MTPFVHHTDRHDVDAAFLAFKRLTGDEEATLQRIDAGRMTVYKLEGAAFSGSWGGKGAIYDVLRAYISGYEAGKEARPT